MFEQHLGRSVTIDQAAALLHVSRRTIYNRIREGKLQTIRTIGGSQRVLLSSLAENRRPMFSPGTPEPARGNGDLPGVETRVAGAAPTDDINAFAVRTAHSDTRHRQES
jgi:excisionase family DNA binding protein